MTNNKQNFEKDINECEDYNCIETAIRDILQKINEVEDGQD